MAQDFKYHNQVYSAEITLPPLGIVAFKADGA
jgi:hypothetical protein